MRAVQKIGEHMRRCTVSDVHQLLPCQAALSAKRTLPCLLAMLCTVRYVEQCVRPKL